MALIQVIYHKLPRHMILSKMILQKKTPARTPPLSPVKERGETPYRQLDAFGLVHSCLFRWRRISRRVVHCLVCNNDARYSPILIWLLQGQPVLRRRFLGRNTAGASNMRLCFRNAAEKANGA